MDRKELMEDFRKQAVEISSHAGEIDTLKFEARLKNGTRFSFNFDDELFTKHENGGAQVAKEKRVSTINAVSDIISAAIALTLMCMCATMKLRAGESAVNALLIITYVSFALCFTVSSIYHLFRENHKRTIKALFQVRHLLLSLSLLLMALSINARGTGSGLFLVLFLLIAVLSIFLSSLETKMGQRLSMLSLAILSLLLPFASSEETLIWGVSIMSAIGSLSAAFANGHMRSNPAFFAAAMLLFYTVI